MNKKVQEILRTSGALLEGHFVLTSGKHSEYFVDKFMFLTHPKFVVELAKMIKKQIKKHKIEYDVIVGPTQGGAILAFELAKQTGGRYFIAEKAGNGRVIKRGGEIRENTKFLIIDDIFTTGKSIDETIEAVEDFGGDVSAIFIIINRGRKDFMKIGGGHLYIYSSKSPNFITFPSAKGFGRANLYWLHSMDLESYEPEKCPFCKEK